MVRLHSCIASARCGDAFRISASTASRPAALYSAGKIPGDSERESGEVEGEGRKEKEIRQRQELCRISKVEVGCKKISLLTNFIIKEQGASSAYSSSGSNILSLSRRRLQD